MTQTQPEPTRVQLALREIAEARERLQLASDVLATFVAAEAPAAVVQEARQLEPKAPPQDLLNIAYEVIHQVFPDELARRARSNSSTARDWLYRVYAVSCAPRGVAEPVATLVVMLAAVKFGLRHQLLLKTETRLGLAHKSPIPNLDLFLETFISEMIEADRSDACINDWLKRLVSEHFPSFSTSNRLDLPTGDYLLIPEAIEPISRQTAASLSASALTSPVDPASGVVIPPASDWRITLGYAEVLYDESLPAFHGKHHSGIDIARYGCFQAPVYAMRRGVVIDSVYLPKGFGNTVTVEHDDGTCLRYTHLDKTLVKKGARVARGRQIGTVGKGAKNIYAAHLHLDMPRSRAYARAGTYYDAPSEVAERFVNPLSQVPASI